MRITVLRSPVLGLLTAGAVAAGCAGVAGAQDGAAGAETGLPVHTQAIVQQLTASRSTSVSGGILAGAGALAPHCETTGPDTVRSATVAGNIMCIISRRSGQPGSGDVQGPGGDPAQQTMGQALEAILSGPR